MGQSPLPVVVIDPGHGGTAAVGGSSPNNATGPNGLLEKNLTLDLAQRVRDALAGEANVILTRTGDTNLSLSDRAHVGRDNNATVFLSIHLNGFHDATVDGTEVWVARNANRRSRDLAQTVLTQLLAVTNVNDRGVREQDFGVLLPERHAADCAVCLAEIAFLTNPAQATRLEGDAYRGQLASALATAVRQQLPVAVAHGMLAGGWDAPEPLNNGHNGYGVHYSGALGTSQSDAARLEWVDLTLVRGSDGQQHLYYLTSGDPDRGRATFRLKVTNTNAVKNFQNTALKLRLSSRRSDGTFRTIPLPGQTDDFLTLRSESIADESSRTIPIVLENATLRAAYHADEPFKRLEVEFHWSEEDLVGWSHYYNRTTLAFFLFHPVEFLFDSTGRPDGEVRFNDPQNREEYWIPIREKAFTETDRSPVTINLAIQTALSTTDSSQISITTRAEATTSIGGEVGASTTNSASLGVEKVIKAGVSSEDTRAWKLTWNESLAREIALNVVRSRSYTTSWTTSRSETVTLDAAPAGQIRVLYAYPVFQRVRTRIVYFGRSNALGQATTRVEVDDFPVLRPSHWGYTSLVVPAAQSWSLGSGAPAPLTLGASVGDGGRNVGADVRALKDQLISLGYNWLTSNATMDAATMRTIRLFQSIIAGRNSVSGDGRIDVPGTTYGWLRAANAPRWQLMPAGSTAEGFINDELADTNDQHDYGTDWLADTIRAAAADYLSTYRNAHAGAALIVVNDVSLPQGGDTPDHAGHETGLACDLKLPRTDGSAGGITVSSSTYDRAAARAQLQSLRRQPLVSRMFLNDTVLIGEGLCTQAAGHDNHIHFEIRPPAQATGGAVAQSLGQGAGGAVSAEALVEAIVGLAEGHGSLLRADYVRQKLRDRASIASLNTVFAAAVAQTTADLADLARRVVAEIERLFILDTSTSSLDLLPVAQRDRYRRFAWGPNDYPGGDDPPAANEGRANEMARDLSRIRPERRPNRGGSAVITEAQLNDWLRLPDTDVATFWDYVGNEMQSVPGQSPHRLNRHALDSFNRMLTAAAADGVTLTIEDADRSPTASQRAAARSGNRSAVASFSSHNLGLAVDFRLSHGSQRYTETTTRPMQNVVDMRESAVHKWLFLRGAAYDWYPYQNEPWHWEYNPVGFRAQFFAGWSGTVPGAAAQALALNAMTVAEVYDVPLVPQPDKLSCWAGAMAMLISFRRQASFPVEELAQSVGRSLRTSYGWDMLESVREFYGFRDIPIPANMSYVPPPEDWYAWLRQYGPLWVTVRGVPSHAVIVAGIHGDLTPAGTTMHIRDPWDTTRRFDHDPVDFNPPNFGRQAELPYTRFAAEFINIDVLQNISNWRILYLPPLPPRAQALGSVAATAVTLGYGVPDGRITDPFYRDRDEKERKSGRRSGRERHLGIDVSTSNASGGGADDARRGLPVYAAIRPSLDLATLNGIAVYADGARTGLGITGSGTAVLANARVFRQPWEPTEAGAYGGVLGLACRYDYTRRDGSSGRFTIYVEYLHLITDRYLPKDGGGNVISARDWAATGKGSGFGPHMTNGAVLSAADLTGGAPLLVGYLGATEFPHVHIQAAYRDGEHGYLRAPRLDPEAVVVAALTVP